MTYPLSSDVVAGQPTAADHYNNLRADALRLGQAAADSNNLADLLTQRTSRTLTIQLLGTRPRACALLYQRPGRPGGGRLFYSPFHRQC